jgi:nucleoside-diphosphate-sugar epimerase
MDQPASQGDFARLASPLFLTGGSGYLGRNLIRHCVARGIAVHALARSPQAAATVSALGARAVRGDLLDPQLADLMTGCRSLVHAAADTRHGHADASQQRTNGAGTANAFAAAQAAGIARAVHIGTESVLLDGRPLIDATEDLPFPRRFAGGYSRSKAQAETIALASASARFHVVGVRPRFVWGRDDTTALPVLVAAARAGQLAWIDGGHYLTSTTHVANLCAGVERAMLHGANGQAYFLADAAPVPFREFVSRLLETQGIAAPTRAVPGWLVRAVASAGGLLAAVSGGRIRPPVTRQDLATMAVAVTLDIGKARRDLGYAPVIGLEEGLRELAAASPSRYVGPPPSPPLAIARHNGD